MARPARLFKPRLESLEDRAVPAVFNVTTTLDVIDSADGKRSLREAITAANNLAGTDLIVLPAGVFKISLTAAGEDANATGDFDVTDAATIRGAGAGATIIDGQQLDRVFDVFGTAPGSIRVVFEKLTVRNGNVTGHGGGIQVGNADLVFRDGVVSGNRASLMGGGVSNEAVPGTGIVTVVRSTVSRNVASFAGGLRIGGSGSPLTVKDSTLRRNIADNGSGGGIRATTATLTNCSVSGNSASDTGGGINADTLTLTNCSVSGNSTNTNGGGINVATATLNNCTISGNSASGGGGGLVSVTTATLTNCTVSDNFAGGDGGGIAAVASTLTNTTVSGNSTAGLGGGLFATTATLISCTIVENIAQTGGGVFHTGGAAISVKNTIIALNLVGFTGAGPDVSGDFASKSHNLIGDGTGSTGFTNGTLDDIVGTSANPIDPKLGPLQNNGGRTKTHALKAGSRAIDRGDNANLPPTDQRGAGFARKKDGNFDGVARVDIGAFER
jgi:predicted outer membrane repeat protein